MCNDVNKTWAGDPDIWLAARNALDVHKQAMIHSHVSLHQFSIGSPSSPLQQAHQLASMPQLNVVGVGNFRVNTRFHPTLVGWNLGLTQEFPSSVKLARLTVVKSCELLPRAPAHCTSGIIRNVQCTRQSSAHSVTLSYFALHTVVQNIRN